MVADPHFMPVLGAALNRRNPNAPRIEVESFKVPARLEGEPYVLVAQGDGSFRWEDAKHTVLATGGPDRA